MVSASTVARSTLQSALASASRAIWQAVLRVAVQKPFGRSNICSN